MFERGRPFQPRKQVSPSVVQVYVWSQEYERARQQIEVWRAESPGNKYARYFAPYPAMMTGDWKEANRLMDEALQLVPNDPLIISSAGHAPRVDGEWRRGHRLRHQSVFESKIVWALHTIPIYQIACTLALTGRRDTAFEWLERSVSTGFACWPFFLKDPCLASLRSLPEFEILISALQAKYPDHLGLL